MTIRLDRDRLTKFCREVFQAAGLAAEHAAIVSDNLMEAELRGVRSHGLIQVKNYAESLKNGTFNKKPRIKVLRETQATLLVDGDMAPGSISGKYAMKKCIEKAGETGIASAAVRNGVHFGMAAWYAMTALPHDMLGFAFCNAQPRTAVYGSIDKNIGTNPICAAIPADREYPVVFDAATSQTAYNKILYAFKEGRRIEKGLALDAAGNDTDDPKTALDGPFLPFGGYKGSGLAIVVDILCSLLTGTAVRIDPETQEPREAIGKVGFYFSAVKIAAFQEPLLFKKTVDLMIKRLKSSRKREEQGKIYMPGELEFISHAEQSAHGINLGESVFDDLTALSRDWNLPFGVEDCRLSSS
ncbi:MAG: Ldh family oxidoreductase [Synergistaceae bacterium]|jgi:LDH2 family malate/lactate/ureidoglycolate dehydrogenase|nr:Ldh family oxidoreductase [Synergistaceae bacterium]